MKTFIKRFKKEAAAYDFMLKQNRSNKREILCLIAGPNKDYAVVDLVTAIELGATYQWAI